MINVLAKLGRGECMFTRSSPALRGADHKP